MDKGKLERYLNGDASETERLDVLRWVEESEENRKELLAYRNLCNAVIFSGEKNGQRVKKRTFPPFLRRFGIVAGAAAVAAVGVFFAVNAERGGRLSVETLSAPAGLITESILSDGTRVCLNAGSTIEFVSGKKGERRVRLDGEAYFDVAKDEKRPFIVETETMDVKVLGTAFNVNGQESSVVLVRGSVQVESRTDGDERLLYRLVPGQRFERNPGNGSGTIAEIDPEDYTSWVNGYLKFNSIPVSQVIRKLQEYYDVEIDSSALADGNASLISGKLDLRVRVDTALVNLEFIAPVRFEKISDREYRMKRK